MNFSSVVGVFSVCQSHSQSKVNLVYWYLSEESFLHAVQSPFRLP